MPTPNNLLPPEAYSWWVLWIGITLILISLVWIGWLVIRYRFARASGVFDEPTLAEISLEMYQRYSQQIGEIRQRYQAGEISARDVHLSLSVLMRALATERSGIDLEVATVSEICEQFRQWPNLGLFLTRCESPSFSSREDSNTDEIINLAYEVIAR